MSDPSFFMQRMQITRPYNGSRIAYFSNILRETSGQTLHVGCADWPIFNLSTNLHATLLAISPSLEGYDPAEDTITEMTKHPVFKDAIFHTTLPNKLYSLVLVPEVIEHVTNPEIVLKSLLGCVEIGGVLLVTAPNAFARSHVQHVTTQANGSHIETVHPDHKYWFSPYTLKKLITSSLGNTIEVVSVSLLEGDTMVCVTVKRLQ